MPGMTMAVPRFMATASTSTSLLAKAELFMVASSSHDFTCMMIANA